MEIVFLETISLGDDINLDRFDELGHVTKYRDTPVELVPERVKDADVVVINKIPMNEKTLAGASHLKLVAVTATGMDNIDRAYTDSHGILSANVAGYSTEAVAQHTFALMFYVLHKLAYYDHYVKSGAYCTSESSGAGTEYFCFGRKLYMDFQTDHGFILFTHLILPPLLLFLQALVLRISSSVHKHTPHG